MMIEDIIAGCTVLEWPSTISANYDANGSPVDAPGGVKCIVVLAPGPTARPFTFMFGDGSQKTPIVPISVDDFPPRHEGFPCVIAELGPKRGDK